MENKEHTLNSIITPLLALIVVVLTFALLYVLMFRQNTRIEENVIIFILGSLTGWVGQILSYFFGSSKGSKEKTDLLNKRAEQQETRDKK